MDSTSIINIILTITIAYVGYQNYIYKREIELITLLTQEVMNQLIKQIEINKKINKAPKNSTLVRDGKEDKIK